MKQIVSGTENTNINVIEKNNNRKSINYKLVVLFTIIEAIFYISVDLPYLSYLGLLGLIIVGMFLKIENILLLLVFLLPNQRMIVLHEFDVTLLNIILIIAFIKIFVLKKEKMDSPIVKIFIAWVIYSSLLAYTGNLTNIAIAIKATLTILTLLYIFKYSINNKFLYYKLIIFFALGCLVASIFALIFSNDYILGSTIRFDPGGENNPNIFGTMLSFAIANLFLLTMLKQRFSIGISLLILSLIVFGIMTQSRSFILALIITFIYCSIFSLFNKNLNRRFLFYMAIAISVLFLVISIAQPQVFIDILNTSMERIFNPRNDDISGGRLELWSSYISLLFSDYRFFLFGIGDFKEYGFISVPHNAFLDIFTSWGILGTIFICIIFSYIFFYLYNKLIKNNYNFTGLIALIPLIVLIITSFTGHSLLGLGVILQFFISILALFATKDIKLHA